MHSDKAYLFSLSFWPGKYWIKGGIVLRDGLIYDELLKEVLFLMREGIRV